MIDREAYKKKKTASFDRFIYNVKLFGILSHSEDFSNVVVKCLCALIGLSTFTKKCQMPRGVSEYLGVVAPPPTTITILTYCTKAQPVSQN